MKRQAVISDTPKFQSHLVKANVMQPHHVVIGQLHSHTTFLLAKVLKCWAIICQDSESQTILKVLELGKTSSGQNPKFT